MHGVAHVQGNDEIPSSRRLSAAVIRRAGTDLITSVIENDRGIGLAGPGTFR